ncbi:MAG: PTS IIA-like nitrogen regulatory protein PtsN [Alphaproteobacteria bacterium]|nr:PTS IIA-like nitrogen regulatory protein PtsN [Alphaproteobacteria bacterium]
MNIGELVSPARVLPALRASSKKQTLQELARFAAKHLDLDERTVFDILLERERLGTTGVGHGVAIPHGKLSTLDRLHGFFARLESPVGFDAIDEQPVDLIFLLLAPETAGADHLKALAQVSRLLRDQNACKKLRESESTDGIYALLTETAASEAA